jgi:hypothetical protein
LKIFDQYDSFSVGDSDNYRVLDVVRHEIVVHLPCTMRRDTRDDRERAVFETKEAIALRDALIVAGERLGWPAPTNGQAVAS